MRSAAAWAVLTAATIAIDRGAPLAVAALALAGAVSALLLRASAGPAAAALAIGAAPLWVSAGQTRWGWIFGGAALAFGLLSRGAGLPLAVALGALGVAAFQAARAWIGFDDNSQWMVLSLATAGASLFGVARVPPLPVARWGLVLVAGVVAARVGWSWWSAPVSPGQAALAVERGVGAVHLARIAADAQLSRAAFAVRPGWHGLGVAVAAHRGAAAALDEGWAVDGAPLDAELRVALALELEARGGGGRALRLLWGGRRAPEVAWWGALLAREQGQPALAEQLLAQGAAAPASTPRLPGKLELDWSLVHDQRRSVVVQLDAPVDQLQLWAWGSDYRGAPSILVGAGPGPAVRLALPPATQALPLAGPWPVGPLRLTVDYDTDLVDGEGDRNVTILALSTP